MKNLTRYILLIMSISAFLLLFAFFAEKAVAESDLDRCYSNCDVDPSNLDCYTDCYARFGPTPTPYPCIAAGGGCISSTNACPQGYQSSSLSCPTSQRCCTPIPTPTPLPTSTPTSTPTPLFRWTYTGIICAVPTNTPTPTRTPTPTSTPTPTLPPTAPTSTPTSTPTPTPSPTPTPTPTPTSTPTPLPTSTPAPTCPRPTNLNGACNAATNILTFTWTSNPACKAYAIRVDDKANAWGGDNPLAGDTVDNNASTPYIRATSLGTSYDWWVHGIRQEDGVYTDSAHGSTIICQVPTSTPTSTPTPTLPPTAPTSTPTSTPTPTLSPTPTPPPGSVLLDLSLTLGDIGPNNNTLPSNVAISPVTIEVLSQSNKTRVVLTKTDKVIYDPSDGKFKRTINLGNTLSPADYEIKIKIERYLKKLVPNIFTIASTPQTQTIPVATTLLAGNINTSGTSVDTIDVLDYNSILSCYGNRVGKTECTSKTTADLNFDGVVDIIDLNICLRNLGKKDD